MSIKAIERKIKRHRELYYKGEPEISDEAFDTLFQELQRLDPTNQVLTQVGSKAEFAKAKHNMKLGSLANAFNKADVEAWLKRIDYQGPLVIEPKLDGSSVELIYKNGDFHQAITRGDGIEGEDITQVIRKIPNVPEKIQGTGTVSFRVEIIFLKYNFEIFNEIFKVYKNRRNAVAGILHRKHVDDEPKYLTAMYFDAKYTDADSTKQSQKLQWIKTQLTEQAVTSSIVWNRVANNIDEIESYYNTFKDIRDSYEYEMDGLVLKVDDSAAVQRIGYDKLNPKFQIAYKLPAETAVVTVLDIKHSVTASGRITPLVVTDEVFIDGATCGRSFSAHNWSWLINKKASIGSKVIVSRHGSVIPQIDETVEEGQGVYNVPIECPNCKGPIEVIGLFNYCENRCLAHKAAVYGIIEALKIKQAGPAMVDKLMELNLVKSPVDLFSLTVEDFQWINMEGNGKKVIRQFKNHQPISLAKLLASVGIEGIGTRFQALVDAGYNTVDKLFDLTQGEIEKLNGFGSIIAEMIVSGLAEKKGLITELLKVVRIEETSQTTGTILQGVGVKFTGKMPQSRAVMEAAAKSKGAVIKWAPNLQNILVIADVNSQSTKAKEARTKGYEIMTPEDWCGDCEKL